MMKEADPRVGFFSILEVMTSAKDRIAPRRKVGSNPTFRLRERSKSRMKEVKYRANTSRCFLRATEEMINFQWIFTGIGCVDSAPCTGCTATKIARLAALRGAVSVPGKRGQKAQPMSLQA